MPKAKQSKTCMFGQVNHKQKFSLYIQWTQAAMLVRTVKHLANGRRFWAGRPRHTLCGLHHNYVTRTRAGKTLPYQPLLKRHTHTGGDLSDPFTAEWPTAQPYDFPS